MILDWIWTSTYYKSQQFFDNHKSQQFTFSSTYHNLFNGKTHIAHVSKTNCLWHILVPNYSFIGIGRHKHQKIKKNVCYKQWCKGMQCSMYGRSVSTSGLYQISQYVPLLKQRLPVISLRKDCNLISTYVLVLNFFWHTTWRLDLVYAMNPLVLWWA